ncbi:MAG TPA: hypothetical protein PL105_15025 [Caldilineaceae bacterium]|mgnify:CR=1 FL=1|nr:hypothetical protein [Caldilineaceae bacterium]
MKRFAYYPELLFISLLLLIAVGQPSLAQTGGDYKLTWTTIDSGGGALTGGVYSLVSSIGQPEPGSTQNGGTYTLNGGGIDAGTSGTTPAEERVFVPLIQR